MVWVFAKDGRHLQCEVTRTDAPVVYRVVLTRPDRTRTVDDVAEPAALLDRLAAVMLDIRAEGWRLA